MEGGMEGVERGRDGWKEEREGGSKWASERERERVRECEKDHTLAICHSRVDLPNYTQIIHTNHSHTNHAVI